MMEMKAPTRERSKPHASAQDRLGGGGNATKRMGNHMRSGPQAAHLQNLQGLAGRHSAVQKVVRFQSSLNRPRSAITQCMAARPVMQLHNASTMLNQGNGQAPLQFTLGEWVASSLRGLGAAGGAYGGYLGGAKAGAALGSYLGPYGAIGGGILGGAVGGLLGYNASGATVSAVQVPMLEKQFRGIREREKPESVGWQAWTDQQTRDLDQIEHQAYTWLNDNRMNPGAKLYMKRVMNLMDGIQGEHGNVINTVHQKDLELWTPDRDDLSITEAAKLQTAWGLLRKGSGNIKTPGGTGGGAADEELRAMHARLLSRPGGRQLLYTLLDQNPLDVKKKKVTINSTPPDMRPDYQKELLHKKRKELKTLTKKMKGMNSKSTEYEEAYSAKRGLYGDIDDLSGGGDAAKARAITGGDAKIGGTGLGSDSRVNVRQGTPDSENLVHDYSGSVLPTPAFIQYGHELIHALHNRNAVDRTAEDYETYKARWQDKEEYQTIVGIGPGALSENLLRKEHGIANRYGYSGTSRFDWERGYKG